ncbi:MAG: FAD-binding oxidoreductase [Gammaproteobacteria bacterium]|nr:FAD-binding oxidoreductase [Gammaproteobacteria bacterium]
MNRRHFFHGSIAAAVAASLSSGQAFGAVLQALTQVTSNINAVTGGGGGVVLEQAAIQELSDSLRGNLLLTGSEAYDKARRVLNKSIDKYPALIVQPSGVADIQNAVTFARERDLLVAVKCGGHSFSGKSTCDGGMQIDLSHFRGVRIDPRSRTAFVDGGSLLADLDHEAMAQGLVTTAGTVSHTGIGGLTLGGGFGRVGRRFGLALDNVKGVDIVTADGQLRHASAEENPDLYWGVRGGGGNFGIVTSFEFNLHPMQRTVVGGEAIYPIERTKDVLKLYAEMSAGAPDDLYVDYIMMAPPDGNNSVAMIHVCYSGPESKADKVLAPLKKLGEPLANTIKAVDYVAIQKSFDNSDPRTGGDYTKSGFTSGIPDGLINAIADHFEPHPDRLTWLYFQQSGGAIGRVDADATAFAHRYSSHSVAPVASWNPGADPAPHFAYVRSYWKELEPHTRGFYTNEVADESQMVVNANYQGNFDRLLKIKEQYDPTNLFRLNANIRRTA